MSTLDYSFPFHAYPQQQQLMEAISECLSLCAVGCFESPTGTGKSLSIICAALTWLLTEESKIIKSIETDTKNKDKKSSSTSDDWLSEILSADTTAKISINQKAIEKYKNMKKRLSNVLDSRYNYQLPANFTRVDKATPDKDVDDQADGIDEFILPNYNSSDEKSTTSKRKADVAENSSSSGSSDDENYNGGAKPTADSMYETLGIPQIYYCSRTHSQISQFVSEIKKTAFKDIRCVTLGSRRSLCVNNSVRKLSSDVAMSEKCLDMQKKKKSNSCKKVKSAQGVASSKDGEAESNPGKCKYHAKRVEKQLADFSLSRVRDIEEVVRMGEDWQACPYYASRDAVRFAQLVCAPYNIILQADMRNSMGLRLKGNVIIFDEAHNLIDTISQLHSAELAVRQLQQVCDAVTVYLERFQSLLNGRNLYYVNLLHSVVKRLTSFMQARSAATSSVTTPSEVVMGVNDFLFQAALDNINLFKLKKHILGVNLANRMGGYADATFAQRRSEGEPSAGGVSSSDSSSVYTHAIRSVLDMMHCLTTAEADGVLVVNCSSSNDNLNSTLKYVMLNPGSYFKTITAEARSVLLVGGTLQPYSYLQDMLFPHLPRSGLRLFSCGHIVPPSHVCALIVGTGPISGSKIEVTFDHRLSPLLLQELHRTVLDVCTIVPHGVVLFFTSYAYMDSVLAYWRENRLLSALEQVKYVFVETRGRSSDGEDIWKKYSAMATKSRKDHDFVGMYTLTMLLPLSGLGALLCSVMGGKLSEGINFSDDLARCVMVVGLPYPDKRDVVFKEKLKYADSLQYRHSKEAEKSCPSEKYFRPKSDAVVNSLPSSRVSSGTTTGGVSSSSGGGNSDGTDSRKASARLYDAVCMRALNQSIGRSVRHAKDYAAIILLDDRFRQPHIIAQLPSWIGNRIEQFSDFNKTKQHLTTFFQDSASFN